MVFHDEPARAAAIAVREDLKRSPGTYVVPHLFLAEFIHVCTRKSGRDAHFVADAVDLFLDLGVRTVGLSKAGLRRATEWACKGLSGYDAIFVAVAEETGGSWITADVQAARVVGRRFATLLGRRNLRPQDKP